VASLSIFADRKSTSVARSWVCLGSGTLTLTGEEMRMAARPNLSVLGVDPSKALKCGPEFARYPRGIDPPQIRVSKLRSRVADGVTFAAAGPAYG
jgi:hypothetical protein